MEATKKRINCKRFLIIFPLGVAAFFGISAIVMLLWNWIIPAVTTWGIITYWQAMGLLVLSKILFGCGFRGGHTHHHKSHFMKHAPFRDRFMEMTDEEKEAFKSQWNKRCCK